MFSVSKIHQNRILILAVLTFILWANTLKNPFMWDDKDLIVEGLSVNNIQHIPFLFSSGYWNNCYPGLKGQYRPVGMVSFAIDRLLWGKDPFGYHVTNVFLHILNVILIYFLTLKIARGIEDQRSAPNIAFFAALLFASHPVHAESVTWIKNRFDLLSLFFLLLTVILFADYISNKAKGRRLAYFFSSLVFFIFSILSKETAFILPFLLVAYAVSFVPRPERRSAVISVLSYFGVLLFHLAFRYKGLIGMVSGPESYKIGLYQHVLIIIKTVGFYYRLLLLPVGLSAEHMLGIPRSFLEPAVIASFAAIALSAVLAFKVFKNSKMLFFSLIWVFIAIIPSSNIIFIASRPIAEQRLYLPSAGVCMLLAYVIAKIKEKKGITATLSLVTIVSLYSLVTVTRNADWSDPVSFWEKTVKVSPGNARAHNNLGACYFDLARYDDAIDQYKAALKLDPGYLLAYNNLGAAYRKNGQDDKAMDMFMKAIKIKPDYAEAYNNLGVIAYSWTDKFEKIEGLIRRAIMLKPDCVEANNNLGAIIFARLGYNEESEKLFKKAIGLKPEYVEPYYNLGLMYDSVGRYQEAVANYKKAVSLSPAYVEAYTNMGAAYSDLGDADRAREAFKKAIVMKPGFLRAHKGLALIYEKDGHPDLAQEQWREVLSIDPEDKEAKEKLSLQPKSIPSQH